MIKKIKNKIKQLFCKHKNIEYFRRKSIYQPLHGERIYMFCGDCGKDLGSRFYTNEELCMSFEEYGGRIKEYKEEGEDGKEKGDPLH